MSAIWPPCCCISCGCMDACTVFGRRLPVGIITGNIEGALLKIEGVKQFVVAHKTVLEAEGMASNFDATLDAHKNSMMQKNALQNSYMNNRKQLTEQNSAKYKALYLYITKIIKAGKLLYDGETKKDEYIVSKVISRMRVLPQGGSSTNG